MGVAGRETFGNPKPAGGGIQHQAYLHGSPLSCGRFEAEVERSGPAESCRAASGAQNAQPPPPLPGDEASLPPGGGKVSVTVDQITKPGAIVSGKVTFSDGQNAEWYLDQAGRLGVVPKQQGYKPHAGRRAAIPTGLAAGSRQAGLLIFFLFVVVLVSSS